MAPEKLPSSTAPGTTDRIQTFREAYYPAVGDAQWQDWRWQLRHRIRDLEGAARVFRLSADEEEAIRRRQGMLPLGITPYYAALIDPDDPQQGLRRTKIPVQAEFEVTADEVPDPLGEEAHSPVPGIVHTYPDKVLFLVTDFCATYCRYCTRSRMVGGGEFLPRPEQWQAGIDYIASHPEIRDVLLSGGDPLILSDRRLESLLERLRALPHVELLRIGTKVPAVLPQRITPELLDTLRRHQPLFLSIHFTHPDELTPEVEEVCNRLADAGVLMGGQTVLLKGVNDDPEVMARLNTGLLRMRVKPYYLHQCDPVEGSWHFRTPVSAGLDILRRLHGRTTGYAVPHFMIDAPGGGGKVPIGVDSIVRREGADLILRNYRGEEYRYHDPGTDASVPSS